MTVIANDSAQRGAALALALGSLLVATLAAGCARDPARRISELRARYSAQASSFAVRQEPVAAPTPPETEAPEAAEEDLGAAPGGAAGPATEGPGPEPEAAGDEAGTQGAEGPTLVQVVLLDVMVRNESPEKLSGITVDVVLVDAQKQEKERRRVWVDTSAVERGTTVQVTLELKDLPYEPGDAFYAEVRHPVPPEERGAYREFAG